MLHSFRREGIKLPRLWKNYNEPTHMKFAFTLKLSKFCVSGCSFKSILKACAWTWTQDQHLTSDFSRGQFPSTPLARFFLNPILLSHVLFRFSSKLWLISSSLCPSEGSVHFLSPLPFPTKFPQDALGSFSFILLFFHCKLINSQDDQQWFLHWQLVNVYTLLYSLVSFFPSFWLISDSHQWLSSSRWFSV